MNQKSVKQWEKERPDRQGENKCLMYLSGLFNYTQGHSETVSLTSSHSTLQTKGKNNPNGA